MAETANPAMDSVALKEQLLRAYLNSIPAEAYVQDLQGNYIYVNRQFETNHDILCDDLARMPHTAGNFYGKEMAQKQALIVQEVIKTGQSITTTTKASPQISSDHHNNKLVRGATNSTNQSTVITMKFPLLNEDGAIVAIGGLVHTFELHPSDAVQMLAHPPTPDSLPLSGSRKLKRPKVGVNGGPVDLDDSDEMDEDDDNNENDDDSGEEKTNEWDEPLDASPNNHSYQRLFSNMQMGAALNEVITDDNNRPIDYIFREINPAFEKLTGLKESETIGRRASEILPGIRDDPCDWIEKFGRVALDGVTYRFERDYCKDLKKYYGGMAYRPGSQEGLFVTLFLDVSDSVQAEEDLRESEERHRNLFESMVQGVVYQDASGSIIAANPSAERILGLTKDQMMGLRSVDPRWKAIKGDGSDFPGDQHPAMIALKTGKPVTGVLMGVLHPDWESHHWIVVDAIPRYRHGEDKPYQVYCTFTDVTQTKEFERRLLREKERVEMANRLKSAFLANMSHEIRTPLNGIIGHIDLALNNELAESYRTENLEGLHVARQSGELLIAIIQDILDLSKIEAGQMDIENDGNFNLRNLVDQVSSLGQTMINQRGKAISFHYSMETGIVDTVKGDVFRLQQVLNNLVSNAIKFTDKGSVTLTVALSEEKGMLQISVIDTGKGVPKDHMESIFEPFRQVEIGDTRKHGGTGLGLTISRKLVEMMGGKLSITSSVEEPTNGSCFSLTFPYRPHAPANGAFEPSSPNISKGNARGAFISGKVLVAEDDVVSRRLVKRMLDISGYDAIVAEDGEEAVEKFKTHDDIALILMDVQMPNMDGLAATTLIRQLEAQNPNKKPVPIIALSAGAMKGDDERGFAVGMTDYLTKPVNFKLLQETLRAHLGSATAPSPK